MVNLILPITNSSEVGCQVGCKVANLSFFSMWSKVVLPALSRPKNNSLPCLFHKPRDAKTSLTVSNGEKNRHWLVYEWQQKAHNAHLSRIIFKPKVPKNKNTLYIHQPKISHTISATHYSTLSFTSLMRPGGIQSMVYNR